MNWPSHHNNSNNKKRKEDDSRYSNTIDDAMVNIANEIEDHQDRAIVLAILSKISTLCDPKFASAVELPTSELITVKCNGISAITDTILQDINALSPKNIFDIDVVFPKDANEKFTLIVYVYKERVTVKKPKSTYVIDYKHNLDDFTPDILAETKTKSDTFNSDFHYIKDICKDIHNMKTVMPSIQMRICFIEMLRKEQMYLIKFYRMESMSLSFIKYLTSKFPHLWSVRFNSINITDVNVSLFILKSNTQLKKIKEVNDLQSNQVGFFRGWFDSFKRKTK